MTSDGGYVHALIDLNLDEFFVGVNHLNYSEFVSVSLSYYVPEPSTALLVSVGLAMLVRTARARGSARA